MSGYRHSGRRVAAGRSVADGAWHETVLAPGLYSFPSPAPRPVTNIPSSRPATFSTRGMVTCPHALASGAGVDILRAGGSAVDAAIATSAALSVLYPHMTGVGGDAFWLIYDAAQGRVRYLDGGGR